MKLIVNDIRQILRQARRKVYTAINFAMTEAYWHIGMCIVQEEQQGKHRAEYGRQIIRELSKQLSAEYGKGFSETNLKNFRQFYLTFPENEICYTLRSELSWSHYRLIMRVDNPKAREYYIAEAAGQNWSTRTLERNINTLWYERRLMTPDKKAALQQQKEVETQLPSEFIKDPYILEFLQLPENLSTSEKEIEKTIVTNLH